MCEILKQQKQALTNLAELIIHIGGSLLPIIAPRDLMPSLSLQALGHICTYIHTHIYIIKTIKKEEERKGDREDNKRGGQETFR